MYIYIHTYIYIYIYIYTTTRKNHMLLTPEQRNDIACRDLFLVDLGQNVAFLNTLAVLCLFKSWTTRHDHSHWRSLKHDACGRHTSARELVVVIRARFWHTAAIWRVGKTKPFECICMCSTQEDRSKKMYFEHTYSWLYQRCSAAIRQRVFLPQFVYWFRYWHRDHQSLSHSS